jgi:PAS domain S-box-containing protein
MENTLNTLQKEIEKLRKENEQLRKINNSLRNRETNNKNSNEQEFSEEQKHFFQLVEFLPLGVVIYNTRGKVIYVNKATLDIFKLENADTFLGADILDSLPDYEKDKIITRFNNILEGKSVPTVEEKVYDSKGNLMNLEVISQKVDFQGNSAIMTLFSDITQRKLTEKALKESEESYRRFFDHSPDPIVIIADGKILSYNKAAIDFIEEESTNSYIGLSIDSFLHPGYSRQVHELLKTIDSGTQYDSMMKLVFITKKGNEKYVEAGAVQTYFQGQKAIQVVWRDITNRIQTYNKLKSSEETYRELFNNANEAIYIQNKDGEFIDVNQGVISMYGYAKDFYIGKTPCDLAAPGRNDMDLVMKQFYKAFNGEPQQFEFWGIRKNGEIFPKIIHLYKAQYFSENVVYAFAVDISDIKNAQAKIEESEERFRLLFNNAADYILIFDPNQGEFPVIVNANESALKAFGYKKEEFIGISAEKITDTKTLKNAPSRIQELKQGQPLLFEARRIRKDGSSFPVEVSTRIITIDNKKLIYSIDRDITERKHAEKEIARLAALIEQIDAIAMITDINGNIEYVNPAFQTITQYTPDEVIGKNPNIIKSSKHSGSFYQNLWNTIKNGEIWHDIIINKKKDGTLYYEDTLIFPVKDRQNNIINYAAIGRDITHEYKLKQQLQQAQKMETVGTLSGGIAHDFNNLLTVINGHAEMALMKIPKDAKVYNDLLAITKAGKRAEKVTNQLLAFSRKQIHEPTVLQINKTVKNLGKMLRRLIQSNISIKYDLMDNIPNIKADPNQIEQILINLVINARDAIDENKVNNTRQIEIKTRSVKLDQKFVNNYPGSKKGNYILISVKDSGIGMDEKIKERVFEPFYTTKETGKGTGLGLSMVYGIIKQNGGSIFIESKPFSGTTFKIFWPATTDISPQSTMNNPINETLAGNESILLVEDDNDVRELVSLALKNFGYYVIEAESGLKAIDYINKNETSIDLMITDIIMPGINGKELALRLNEKISLDRVLFVSGYSQDHLLQNGSLQQGINFLQKPYPIDILIKKVREILDAVNKN